MSDSFSLLGVLVHWYPRMKVRVGGSWIYAWPEVFKYALIEICPFEEKHLYTKIFLWHCTQFYPRPPPHDTRFFWEEHLGRSRIKELQKWPLNAPDRIKKGPFFKTRHIFTPNRNSQESCSVQNTLFHVSLVAHVYNTCTWLLPPPLPDWYSNLHFYRWLQISSRHFKFNFDHILLLIDHSFWHKLKVYTNTYIKEKPSYDKLVSFCKIGMAISHCNWQIITKAYDAVTKRHQRLGEICIIFTRTSSRILVKLISNKFCHAVYALDTRDSPVLTACACYRWVHFIQHARVINAWVTDRVFLWNNFSDFPYSAGKNFKI